MNEDEGEMVDNVDLLLLQKSKPEHRIHRLALEALREKAERENTFRKEVRQFMLGLLLNHDEGVITMPRPMAKRARAIIQELRGKSDV